MMNPGFPYTPDSTSNKSVTQAQTHEESVEISSSVVPAACVACRSKHLKCDGGRPCSRCSLQQIECNYVKSRRGYKGPRRKFRSGKFISSTITASRDDSLSLFSDSLPAGALNHAASDTLTSYGSIDQSRPLDDNGVKCFEAFYHYFFPSHPFVLPQANIVQYLRTRSLHHLEAAIQFVGSHYIADAPTQQYATVIDNLLLDVNVVQDVFLVQSMLLVAIALDGDHQRERTVELLTRAHSLTLKLGLNDAAFAVTYGESSSILEESCRRTWWELYVIDGMVAGVHQKSSFRSYGMGQDVGLPCGELEYLSGIIPTPETLEDVDESVFASSPPIISSYAYRILAMRLMGRILTLPPHLFHTSPELQSADTALTTFILKLPPSQSLAVNADGHVDELLFQAYMIAYGCQMLLHRSLSQLSTTVTQPINACAPSKDIDNTSSQQYNTHALKIIKASEGICDLIKLPADITTHTHFFTCVITLASIVQLTVWANLPLSALTTNITAQLHSNRFGASSQELDIKSRLELCTAGLKRIATVWESASVVLEQIRGVAREVAHERKKGMEMGWWGVGAIVDEQDREVEQLAIEQWDELEMGNWIVGEENDVALAHEGG